MELMVIVALAVVTVGFVARTYIIERQLEQLQRELREFRRLEKQLGILEQRVGELLKRDEAKVSERVAAKTDDVIRPALSVPAASQAPTIGKPEPISPSSSRGRGFAVEDQKPSRTREELEAFVGGKLLNRIGALALIIGVGFFLKYAFDKEWISEPIRVLIGVAVGIICLAGAYRSHLKGLGIFAQGLVGAGIAILYLSVYASFNFYALEPQWVAFILMAVVTAFALAQSLHYDSIAVALLGWAGGFLTPVLLSTGQSNEIGLFTYIGLLDVALLGMLLQKDLWAVLEPLTLLGTWILYGAWSKKYYASPDLWTTVFFVSLFWFLFHALDFIRLLRARHPMVVHHITSALNGVITFGVLYSLIDPQYDEWMGVITLVLGLIYLGCSIVAGRRGHVEPLALSRYVLSAITFLAIATMIQFSNFTTVIVWLLEAVVLVWCGLHWRLNHVWMFAAGLFAVALLKFCTIDGAFASIHPEHFTLLFNQRTLTLVVGILTTALGGWLMSKPAKETSGSVLDWAGDALNFTWCVLLFVLLTVEANDYFQWKLLDQQLHMQEVLAFNRLMTLSVLWTAGAVLIGWIGFHNKILPVAIASLFMLTLAVILATVRGISYEPISDFSLLFNIRAGALFLVLAGMIGFDRLSKEGGEGWGWLTEMRNVHGVILVIVLLLLLTAEARDFFEKQIAAASVTQEGVDSSDLLARLHNLQQLVLSGVWLLYSVALMAIGIWRSIRSFRIVAFVLFGITILKIFIYDLSFLETLYKIFSFIGLGVILLGMSYVYQRYKDAIFGNSAMTR